MNTEGKVLEAITAYQKTKGRLEEARAAVPAAERALESAAAALAKTIHGAYGDRARVLEPVSMKIYSIDTSLNLTEESSGLRML